MTRRRTRTTLDKSSKNVGGRPNLTDEGERILKNNLFARQWTRLQAEAKLRGNTTSAAIMREAVDWYFTALDAARANLVPTPDQDRVFEELATGKEDQSNIQK